jgi:hypothetical protein
MNSTKKITAACGRIHEKEKLPGEDGAIGLVRYKGVLNDGL